RPAGREGTYRPAEEGGAEGGAPQEGPAGAAGLLPADEGEQGERHEEERRRMVHEARAHEQEEGREEEERRRDPRYGLAVDPPAAARTSGSAAGRSRAASARPRRRSARRSRGGVSIPASHAPVRKMPVPRTQSTGPKSPRASAYGPNMAAIGRKGMTSSRTPTA